MRWNPLFERVEVRRRSSEAFTKEVAHTIQPVKAGALGMFCWFRLPTLIWKKGGREALGKEPFHLQNGPVGWGAGI